MRAPKSYTLKILGILCALCLLSGCYTNFNQLWFRAHTEYSGYELNYSAEGGSLPRALYKHGEDWYIAAYPCTMADRAKPVHGVSDSFHRRHVFRTKARLSQEPWYHKITPEMAAWLLRADAETVHRFKAEPLLQDMQKAGGDWLRKLPQGAVAVPSEFLKYNRGSLHIATESKGSAPWYSYPAAGLTFLAVDIPATIVCNTVFVLSFFDDLSSDREEEEEELLLAPAAP